jgi:hypothetical protein
MDSGRLMRWNDRRGALRGALWYVAYPHGGNTMVFRRPELEKDNPIAPEPYVGPRRRLALARAASSGKLAEAGDMRDTLQTLAEAVSRYVDRLPRARKTEKGLKVLRDAIAQAERVLAAEERSEKV